MDPLDAHRIYGLQSPGHCVALHVNINEFCWVCHWVWVYTHMKEVFCFLQWEC